MQLFERRFGVKRTRLFSPERNMHAAAVEWVCEIAGNVFAIEHTGIEPFEGHMQLSFNENAHFEPIKRNVAGKIPPSEHFVLHIDAMAMRGRNRQSIADLQNRISNWIIETAPALPIARLDSLWSDTRYNTISGTSVSLSLHRVAQGGPAGELSVVHLVARSGFEENRKQRIKRAIKKKAPKLRQWKAEGATSVLVLEENDRWLSNHWLIADAVYNISSVLGDERPDECYLIGTSSRMVWFLNALWIGESLPEDLSIHGGFAWEIDPNDLSGFLTEIV